MLLSHEIKQYLRVTVVRSSKPSDVSSLIHPRATTKHSPSSPPSSPSSSSPPPPSPPPPSPTPSSSPSPTPSPPHSPSPSSSRCRVYSSRRRSCPSKPPDRSMLLLVLLR